MICCTVARAGPGGLTGSDANPAGKAGRCPLLSVNRVGTVQNAISPVNIGFAARYTGSCPLNEGGIRSIRAEEPPFDRCISPLKNDLSGCVSDKLGLDPDIAAGFAC